MGFKEKTTFFVKNPSFFFNLAQLKKELAALKKKKVQLWVFQCDYKAHYSYLKPYYEYGRQIKDVAIFFTVGYSKKNDKPTQFLLEQGVPRNRILEPIDYLLYTDWDVYMSPTEWGNVFPRNIDALRVQIFHTLGDKKIEYSKELLDFNIVFANGPIHHEFLNKYIFSQYPEASQKIEVADVGFAKIDELFQRKDLVERTRASLKIPTDDRRPVLLYAPNWEVTSALNTYGEQVFQVLSQLNYISLIKLHYMSLITKGRNPLAGDQDWRPMMKKYSNYDNIRVVDDENINNYLALADIMVTDYGGASLEFMALNKPIVYLDCPQFFELRGHDIFEYQARKTGRIIDNPKQLESAIQDSLSENDPFEKKRKEMIQRLLFNPGEATSTGFEFLYKRVSEKKTSSSGTVNS